MTQTRVLAWVPSLFRLGAAAEMLCAASEIVRRGVDLQLVTYGNDRAAAVQNDALGVVVHYCGREGADWINRRRLWTITRNFSPDVTHNWCGPAWPDSVWNIVFGPRIRLRILTHESDLAVQRRLSEMWRAPTCIVLPVGDAGTGDGETGAQFFFRNKAVPTSTYPADLPLSRPGNVSDRASLRAAAGVPAGAQMVVAVSKLEPVARLKDLIWATDLLCCIRDDLHLVIAGSGAYRSGLERFARLTDCAPHIHFVGDIADPQGLVAAADVFWQASPEIQSRRAIRLAMQSGVPVVASAGPGSDGLVLHQQTGLSVPPGSREGFARWTKFLLEQKPRREQLIRQARQFVSRCPASSNLAELLAGLYLGGAQQTTD